MADAMVLQAQKFVYKTYGSRNGMTVAEDGKTSWNTMDALSRSLHWELSTGLLPNSFRPTTLSTLQLKHPKSNASTVPAADAVRIIQSALHRTGCDGGGTEGKYSDRAAASTTLIKQCTGVDEAYPRFGPVPKVLKGLLTVDASVTVDNGFDETHTVVAGTVGNWASSPTAASPAGPLLLGMRPHAHAEETTPSVRVERSRRWRLPIPTGRLRRSNLIAWPLWRSRPEALKGPTLVLEAD